MSNTKQIVLGITGASGAIYAERYIRGCAQIRDISLSVILTETARTIWLRELGYGPEELISECGASILPNDSFDAPFLLGIGGSRYAADTPLLHGSSRKNSRRTRLGCHLQDSGRTAQRTETTDHSAA
jgi:hypothetical protein